MKKLRGRAQNESYTHTHMHVYIHVIITNKSWISFYVSGNNIKFWINYGKYNNQQAAESLVGS